MVTIVFAYRNREVSRIKISLDSLQNQNNQNFKVVFVDYGSESKLADQILKLVQSYSFSSYYYVPTHLLLWNKSKALNYGITKAETPYVFIADVDIVFHANTITLFQNIANLDKAYLFKLGYLDKKVSENLKKSYVFEDLKPKHFGTVNGMILIAKEALVKINGFDTFFHFYGSEDVDLYERIKNAGYEIVNNESHYFYHNHHVIYNSYNDKEMSVVPRLYNIKRINEEHYLINKAEKLIVPHNQGTFGEIVSIEGQDYLKNPDKVIRLYNIHAHVHHFFNEHLKTFKNKVVQVVIEEDEYCQSMKYFLKELFKKNSQPYLSMKAVNDLVLMKILYDYKDFNYAYLIADNLKKITFTIKL